MRRILFGLLFCAFSVSAAPAAKGLDSLCQKVLEAELPDNSFPYRVVCQSTSYTCGPACVKSALRRFGVGHPGASELELAGLLGSHEKLGTSPAAVVKLFRHLGFEARWEQGLDMFKLESDLTARHVVMALMEFEGARRWVLVVGMDPFSVFYMDPAVDSNHYLRMTQLDFEDHWLHNYSNRTWRRAAVVVRTH